MTSEGYVTGTESAVAPSGAAAGDPPARGGAAAWAPVAALTLGIAALVASEFLPASVLPAMASDVGVSEGTAGLAVAATAVAGAVTAPTIAVVLPRTDRRTVLLGLLAAAVVSNAVVAVTPNFPLLLVGRLLLGVAIAGFWSFALGAGTHAAPGRDHVVSTSLALGVSAATIVGVPLSSVLGDAVGWRPVFWSAAGLSVLALVAVAATVPPVPAQQGAGLGMLRQALANRRLMAGTACIGLVAFGNFAAYPYIRLAIERVTEGSTVWLLLGWGIGGLAGNLAAGMLSRRLGISVVAGPALLAVSLLALATTHGIAAATVAIVVWGFGFNMMPVASQLWVTRAEPKRIEPALALQVTAFQVAITAGSAIGGAVVDGGGVRAALLVGVAAALAGSIGFGVLRTPRP
ncbi:MFS transporter [Streptomyces cocklensis]|jgi:DHA1 family purine ribonucleoside efflux pump-like MFS transporter|uniref:MFS transporter, DHA1 family, purine ribonucleoside efflux pump n=1 Tax=Actinacidiphila cocklensis TaxID=887465 RepID=A0A9W4DXM8_9ACTN|nr:MFS transporter [Actinacidiphila cocklensis]MDD1056756.1 MFS transporter [Actinacidiphila cocklensis]WSX77911.1 MFS transporter [Streptomyces sp. NBC_00899]CAG6397763.1 MFS transporter, DHA1 family, purine ribonucleoside efflux pump [Actinacidiphila cocklensis]